MASSGNETGQGDLKFLYSNILGNRDLETTAQEFLLKMTIVFSACWLSLPVTVSKRESDNGHHVSPPVFTRMRDLGP